MDRQRIENDTKIAGVSKDEACKGTGPLEGYRTSMTDPTHSWERRVKKKKKKIYVVIPILLLKLFVYFFFLQETSSLSQYKSL